MVCARTFAIAPSQACKVYSGPERSRSVRWPLRGIADTRGVQSAARCDCPNGQHDYGCAKRMHSCQRCSHRRVWRLARCGRQLFWMAAAKAATTITVGYIFLDTVAVLARLHGARSPNAEDVAIDGADTMLYLGYACVLMWRLFGYLQVNIMIPCIVLNNDPSCFGSGYGILVRCRWTRLGRM